MLWLFVGPTGVYLLDFFCSGIQFNLLLSPYPCFISLLYLDLYVLGVDASVGYRTGNHYRLSEYSGRLIIDYTIENFIQFKINKLVT